MVGPLRTLLPVIALAACSDDGKAWWLQKSKVLVSKPVFFDEIEARRVQLTIPTSVAPTRVVVYSPPAGVTRPAVHVNFHAGGFVMAGMEFDDDQCRYLAHHAGVVVVNVDYVLAPQHRAPQPAHQAYEVVRWVAEHAAEHGWDGSRLTVGGQSAGGNLAAAVARQALEQHGPPIALQVLHYAPLDLASAPAERRSPIPNPMITPRMAEIFRNAYAPSPEQRLDRLVSPANPADTADLRGIAPALIITPEYDTLHEESVRYGERLAGFGALVERFDVAGGDHAYDMNDRPRAETSYALIARRIREATAPR